MSNEEMTDFHVQMQKKMNETSEKDPIAKENADRSLCCNGRREVDRYLG